MILNCLYRTDDREDFTLGGKSAREEMCFQFLYYYPRINQSLCQTSFTKESAFTAALESFKCNNVYVNGSTIPSDLETRARNIEWTKKMTNTLEITQSINPNGTVAFCIPSFNIHKVTIPRPGVDYEVFPYRYDTCGRYNGTYYPGGEDADYYYDCDTNEPYFDPIGPTDSSATLPHVLLWMAIIPILALLYS